MDPVGSTGVKLVLVCDRIGGFQEEVLLPFWVSQTRTLAKQGLGKISLLGPFCLSHIVQNSFSKRLPEKLRAPVVSWSRAFDRGRSHGMYALNWLSACKRRGYVMLGSKQEGTVL